MFEAAELGHKLSKDEFRKIEPNLRAELLEAQFALAKDGRFPVLILISGVRAGKGETVNLLNEWMDVQAATTHRRSGLAATCAPKDAPAGTGRPQWKQAVGDAAAAAMPGVAILY